MQRSSETIGTIAAALAKAQAQLVNPEKFLVGTIRSNEAGTSERSFRYAPLSSGLDIVRKTLSQHEIATVQTTSIEESAGIVRPAPHRMGAALTYARRYALLTLVGIAGEDDLDASDLATPTIPTAKIDKPAENKISRLNGGQGHSTQQFSGDRRAKAVSNPRKPTLEPESSAALCEQLMAELGGMNSAEDGANWRVERAFQARLASLITEAADDQPMSQEAGSRLPRVDRGRKQRRATSINKSVLSLPAPRRIRDRDHVKLVAKQSCLICGRRPADAHHLRFAQSRALGRKASDEYTVPLCRGHHREVHRSGDEAEWWKKVGIDPTVPARALRLESHPLPAASCNNTALHRLINAGQRGSERVESRTDAVAEP
jgi:hypothetical protein